MYISDDLVHWRNITPPGALASDGLGGHANEITQASWISSTTGWVETCRTGSEHQAIFQTDDGGRTWQSIADPSSPNGMYPCEDTIQLVSPTVGIDESKQPGLGSAPLYVTNNDGRTWAAPYSLVDGKTNAVPNAETMFASPDVAIALGSPPDNTGPGVQVSGDAGHTWTTIVPPAPGAPTDRYNSPAFEGAEEILPVVGVTPGGDGTVQVDTSTDNGRTWVVAGRVPFQAPALPASPYASPTTTGPTFNEDVSLSVAQDGTWWLALPTASPSISVSTDQGRTWKTVDAAGLPGHGQIRAINQTSVLATAIPSSSVHTAVFKSADGGQHWTVLQIPAS